MGTEVKRLYRSEIPVEHCTSTDARLTWLWNQRLGVAQAVFANSKDIESKMAASMILTCAMLGDLSAIEQLFQRLEGAPVSDQELLERGSMPI